MSGPPIFLLRTPANDQSHDVKHLNSTKQLLKGTLKNIVASIEQGQWVMYGLKSPCRIKKIGFFMRSASTKKGKLVL